MFKVAFFYGDHMCYDDCVFYEIDDASRYVTKELTAELRNRAVIHEFDDDELSGWLLMDAI